MTATVPRNGVRAHIAPGTVLRVLGCLTAVLVSGLVASPVGGGQVRDLVLASVLLMLPLDLLPIIMIITIRSPSPVAGPLNVSDVVALVYLARLAAGSGLLRIQITRSRVALLLFLSWAVVTTMLGHGLSTALARIALYAAVGVAVTHRRQAKTCLFVGIAGFAIVDVISYLPYFPERMWGFLIDDPAHVGALLMAALIIVSTSPLSRSAKVALGALLLFGILMTLTRSVWFATGVVGLAALLPRRWYVPLLLPPALALVMWPLVAVVTSGFGLNPQSTVIRTQSMTAGLQQFEKSPFLGHGWAFTSAVGELGLTGANNMPLYNLWIYLGVSVGLIGIALFVAFVAFLAYEAAGDPAAYLFIVASLSTGLSEMHLYACSLTALLLFVMTSARPEPPGVPGHSARSRAAISSRRSRATANVLVIGGSGSGTGTSRFAADS